MTSLVSRENRAIHSGKGREKMQGHRQTLSETKISENTDSMHHTPPQQQDGCFTPKRQLPRTPPRSCRSPLARSGGIENGAGRTGNVQDVCFTPTHTLRHSPVSKQETTKLRTASTASSAQTRSKQTISSTLQTIARKSRDRTQKARIGPATKTQHHDTGDRSLAACFTPTKTLARSPPNKRRALGQDQEPSVLDGVPPPTRWEIPRTPVQRLPATTPHQSSRMLQVDAADSSRAGGLEESESRLDGEVKRGPVPVPDPPLRRQFGNETMTDLDRRACATTTVMESGRLENESSSTVVAEDHDTIPTEVSLPVAIATHPTEPVHHTSPPIGAGRETEFTARLPGLVCTENDLSYLQRMKNIKQYEQLQARVAQLDKDLKATAQRKEQLDHETLKISRDLVDMRTRYCGTVSVLHGLISTQSEAGAEVRPSSDEGPASTGPIPELTQGNIARLKRVHNLTAAQFEKMGKELTSKLLDIELQKQELEKQLKEEETRGEAQKQKLYSQLHSTKEQRSEWEMKVQEAVKERATIETKLTELQSRVSRLKLSTACSDSSDSCDDQEAKRRAEERLKRVIRRCELYVQRHQMLREMGVKGRRGN